MGYFGVTLEQIIEREGGIIPTLVEKAVDYLIEHGNFV